MTISTTPLIIKKAELKVQLSNFCIKLFVFRSPSVPFSFSLDVMAMKIKL